jgi:hypothetical protein
MIAMADILKWMKSPDQKKQPYQPTWKRTKCGKLIPARRESRISVATKLASRV